LLLIRQVRRAEGRKIWGESREKVNYKTPFTLRHEKKKRERSSMDDFGGEKGKKIKAAVTFTRVRPKVLAV